jgi:hypothetical protein
LLFEENKMKLNTSHLSNGVYSLQVKSDKCETVSKRFVISR